MNTPDDLARQKRDYDEQIFRDHGAEMKHTPTPAIQHIVDILETKNHAGIDIEIGSTALKSLIRWSHEAQSDHARLLAQNEAMRSALEEVTNLLAHYPRDEASEVVYKAARAALNPPPTK